MSVEPTIAKRLTETAPGQPAGTVAVGDGRLWRWVARYTLPNRWTQRARQRARRNALQQMRGAPDRPAVGHRSPGPLSRLRPANANRAPDRGPAPLLPPEAPLEMPEQDLS